MIPIIYPATEESFENNGLGRLTDAISCKVTEERNGAFYLELEYPLTGQHYAELVQRNIIYAYSSDKREKQAFRISKISKPLKGIVTVSAYHISYDLTKIPVMPFAVTAATLMPTPGKASVFHEMMTNVEVRCPFNLWSDKTGNENQHHFGVSEPASMRAIVGGGDSSILSIYGGEIEWDNFDVNIWEARGADNGVTILYGKNMTGLTAVEDSFNSYGAVLPFYIDKTGDTDVIITIQHLSSKIVSLPGVETYGEAVPLDLSNAFEYAPSSTQLYLAAEAWLEDHQPQNVIKELTVSFAPLWQSEEYRAYAPLQQVNLCDTVTVQHAELGVNEKLKVVKTVYDVLRERYDTIELGAVQNTVADEITSVTKAVKGVDFALHQIVDGEYTGGTFINEETIYSPTIRGGEMHIGPIQSQGQLTGYNINLEKTGDASFAGDVMIAGDNHVQGFFKVVDDDENELGAMGRAQGSTGRFATNGVALIVKGDVPGFDDVDPEDDDFEHLDPEDDNFVIVTDAGVRLHFGTPTADHLGWDLYLSEQGAFYPHGGYTGSNAEIATWGDIIDQGYVDEATVRAIIEEYLPTSGGGDEEE